MLQTIMKKTQHRNSKQAPGGRNWSGSTVKWGTLLLTLHAHIQLCFYTSQDQCLEVTLSTVSLIFQYQPLIKKIHPQTSLQGSLMEALSKVRFPDVPSLYQVDRKLTNTVDKVRDLGFALCWASCVYRKWNRHEESRSIAIASLVCVSLCQCGPNGLTSESQK